MPRRRTWLRLLIAIPLLALLWYFVGKSLAKYFAELSAGGWDAVRVDWSFAAASVGALFCARLTNALNTKQVLAAMGAQVRAGQVVPIMWFSWLGRYIPLKIGVVAGAMILLTRLGIRMPVVAAALFLSTALMILMALLASAPLMQTGVMREWMPYGWIVSLVTLGAGVICLYPPVFTRLVNLVLRRLGRQPMPDRLQIAPYLRAIAMTVLRTLFLGLALWCAARAVGPFGLEHFPLALGAGGVAAVMGFVAFFSPAGFGVHEGVYLLILSPVLGAPAALAVVLFRIFNIIVDAITGGIGMMMLRGSTDGVSALSSSPVSHGNCNRDVKSEI